MKQIIWAWNVSDMDLFKAFNEKYELKPEYKKKQLQADIDELKNDVEYHEKLAGEKRRLIEKKEAELAGL